jgi:hypothetical protein
MNTAVRGLCFALPVIITNALLSAIIVMPDWLHWIIPVAAILQLPGILLSMPFISNLHGNNTLIWLLTGSLFYFLISYGMVSIWSRRVARSNYGI